MIYIWTHEQDKRNKMYWFGQDFKICSQILKKMLWKIIQTKRVIV